MFELCRPYLFLALLSIILAGCGNPKSILEESEDKYDVGILPVFGTNLRIYHAALLDPSGIHLESPGYVVGIEKTGGLLGSRYVTHMIEYGGNEDVNQRSSDAAPAPCLLYSIYTLTEKARLNAEPLQSCRAPGGDDYATILYNSLKHRLLEHDYSHIILMVMGWNTDQQEAVKNYNQIAGNIQLAWRQNLAQNRGNPGKVPFNPLVIGVSWPSEWLLGDWSTIPAALVRGASFAAKKDQADEVGRGFLQPILTRAILPARMDSARQIPLVMIGHSFGARALAAMFFNYHEYQGADSLAFLARDKLIMLEGAFDISELFDANGLLASLKGRSANDVLDVTMTASFEDTAFDLAIWGNYLGDSRTFTKVCSRPPSLDEPQLANAIECGEAVSDESWGLQLCNTVPKTVPIDESRVTTVGHVRYLDASKLINCQTPFGGGGAHDDFYRPEMGRFLADEIQRVWQ